MRFCIGSILIEASHSWVFIYDLLPNIDQALTTYHVQAMYLLVSLVLCHQCMFGGRALALGSVPIEEMKEIEHRVRAWGKHVRQPADWGGRPTTCCC